MKKIGFIGAGNMATAIIKGLISQNGSADYLGVFDLSEENAAQCGRWALLFTPRPPRL